MVQGGAAVRRLGTGMGGRPEGRGREGCAWWAGGLWSCPSFKDLGEVGDTPWGLALVHVVSAG